MKKRRLLSCLFSAVLMAFSVQAQETEFRHPGILHSEADFEAVRARLAAEDSLTKEALDALRYSPCVGGDHGHNWGVNEVIIRGVSGQNYMNAYRNAHRAYQCALLWKITGEKQYADIAVDVLNAYRIWNKALGGNTNVSLIPGFTGYPFINAAEIMRDYEGWPEEEFELFKQYMIDVWFTAAQDFLERRHDTVFREQNWYHYHSNWGLGNAMFCVSLGILCDLPDIYNYGMYWMKEGPGNESLCVTALHPDAFGQGLCGYGWGLLPWFHKDGRGPLGYLNQMQESGRDQGHSMAALGLLSYALEAAWNQGDNAFCNLQNPMIKGLAGSAMVAGAAEYVAAYNSGTDNLPYTQNWWMGGLNGTGRGQWRPIWQLFINHYENRMGIPMNFCHTMKNIMGMERGGGSYGNNSGGYDHTGFGDLMYNDAPVAREDVPAILFPMISSPTATRRYAEISNVEPGTVLTLSATLPEGEENTGNWKWEDGATGQQRQITADHSGLYRLTYTNPRGVVSTQLFSVAVRGEGIKASLTSTATYNGRLVEGSDILMGQGRKVVISTAYSNWNYIESEEWFDETGKKLGTGGAYTYTLTDNKEHTLTFRLTNQSGVVLEKVFNIIPNENELTNLLADPDCEKPESWNVDAEGFVKGSGAVSGTFSSYIERRREQSENGMNCWGLDRFNISQTLTGLKPGRYELGASVMAAQQGRSGDASRNYVKDIYLYADGVNTAVATRAGESGHFTVNFYVGKDGKATLGAKNVSDQNFGYSDNGCNWFAMDNFSLVYEGTDYLAADLETMRAELDKITDDMVTPALMQRIEMLKKQTADGVEGAVECQRLLGEVRMLRVHYDDYKAVYERCLSFLESENLAGDELRRAVDAFAGAETADEVFRAYETMDRAWKGSLPQASVPVDLTMLLPEGGKFVPTASGVSIDDVTQWMTDAEGGNFRVFAIDGSDAQRGDAKDENMMERWCTGNFLDGQYLIYTCKSGMPAGRYVFKAAAQKGAGNGVIELFVNDATSPVTSTGVLRMEQVEAVVNSGKLTLGLKAGNGNGTRWTSMSDVSLEYQSPGLLLRTMIADSDTLNYGTDKDGALQKARNEAQDALTSGSGDECMDAYSSLVKAMEQYRLDNASPEHPVILTERMINGGFDIGNATGWAVTSSDGNYPKFAGGVIEFWHSNFTIQQLLTGLPQGNYRVSAQARSDQGASNKNFRVFVKTTGGLPLAVYSTAMTRADGTDIGLHLGQNAADLNADPGDSRISVDVFVGDGLLTVGAQCDVATSWCVLNDFVLEYFGMNTGDLDQMWATQVAVANSLDRTRIPATVAGELDKAVDVDVASITTDSLTRALSILMGAIENARGIMTVYDTYLVQKAIVDEIADNSKPRLSSSLTIFRNNIKSARVMADKALTTGEVQAACDNLETARRAYVVDAEPLNGIGFDMTFRVASASCDNATGWLNDATVNFRTLVNSGRDNEYSGVFLENWIGPDRVLQNDNRAIYQTVNELPSGNYELKAAVFRKVELSDADPSEINVSLYLNGQQTEVTAETFKYFTVKGAVSKAAEIGVKCGRGNTANWIGMADVTLMYYGKAVMELNEEDAAFDIQDGLYGDVLVHQTLEAGEWNILCLPFDVPSTQMNRKFVRRSVKELKGMEMNGIYCDLKFETVSEMKAGVPYLVQVASSVHELDFTNVTLDAGAIEANESVVTDGDVTVCLQGTSHKGAVYHSNLYTYDDDSFTKAEMGADVNGFRAYLRIDGAIPECVCIYIDGKMTSIREIRNEALESKVNVYTIDGRLVRNGVGRAESLDGLPSGMYIINGKKVLK